MKQQSISLVTLGVSDYERAKAFYSALGWTPALDVEQTAFYPANGVTLVLWLRERLSEDCGIADDGATWGGVAMAHNVASRDDVDDIVDLARRNGAMVTREPSETFYGGYAGVFRDPDGHVWEIAYNPGFTLDRDGAITVPDFGAS